jgi:hypothetical protein
VTTDRLQVQICQPEWHTTEYTCSNGELRAL